MVCYRKFYLVRETGPKGKMGPLSKQITIFTRYTDCIPILQFYIFRLKVGIPWRKKKKSRCSYIPNLGVFTANLMYTLSLSNRNMAMAQSESIHQRATGLTQLS